MRGNPKKDRRRHRKKVEKKEIASVTDIHKNEREKENEIDW